MKSLRIVVYALVLSLLGHLILYFGIPWLSFSSPSEIPEDLIIKTELKGVVLINFGIENVAIVEKI